MKPQSEVDTEAMETFVTSWGDKLVMEGSTVLVRTCGGCTVTGTFENGKVFAKSEADLSVLDVGCESAVMVTCAEDGKRYNYVRSTLKVIKTGKMIIK